MADRYFSEIPVTADTVLLEQAEAHHLLHVMRAKVGQQVVIFDGSGCEFAARINKLSRSSVELAVLSREAVDRELKIPVTLGVALPKGDRQKWLVEKLTELGVHRLVPLETTRGVAQPVSSALERLTRNVIEASKQCGRNLLLHLDSPQSAASFFSAGATGQNVLRWIAHPDGSRIGGEMELARGHGGLQNISLAVGPEGGFTDEEVSLAISAGWKCVSLGNRILRIETAAVALAALCCQLQ